MKVCLKCSKYTQACTNISKAIKVFTTKKYYELKKKRTLYFTFVAIYILLSAKLKNLAKQSMFILDVQDLSKQIAKKIDTKKAAK